MTTVLWKEKEQLHCEKNTKYIITSRDIKGCMIANFSGFLLVPAFLIFGVPYPAPSLELASYEEETATRWVLEAQLIWITVAWYL